MSNIGERVKVESAVDLKVKPTHAYHLPEDDYGEHTEGGEWWCVCEGDKVGGEEGEDGRG